MDQEPQQRKSRRKRKPLPSAALAWDGRTAKLAPTVKSFSCSLCSYTVKNRFDSLRWHLKGKHKLGPEDLQLECAKFKVSTNSVEIIELSCNHGFFPFSGQEPPVLMRRVWEDRCQHLGTPKRVLLWRRNISWPVQSAQRKSGLPGWSGRQRISPTLMRIRGGSHRLRRLGRTSRQLVPC